MKSLNFTPPWSQPQEANHNHPALNPVKLTPVRTAAQRLADAQNQPEILPLMGEIWKSQELHILFADTGVGKSILAVTIADLLSKGNQLGDLENAIPPQRVLFYDFELSDKQFQKRYSHDKTGNLYQFSDQFFIDNIDWYELDQAFPGMSLEKQIFSKIEADLERTQAKVLIVDNLTFLQTRTTEKTDVALELMRKLIELKRQFGLSILVLAHTPKKPPGDPLSLNHLAGSRQIPNFADSASAIGKSSQGPQTRYWKQVKPSRSGVLEYDSENVLVYEVEKRFETFLSFLFIGYEQESNHLGQPNDNDQEMLRIQARQLQQDGKTTREIADLMGKGKSTISRWLK